MVGGLVATFCAMGLIFRWDDFVKWADLHSGLASWAQFIGAIATVAAAWIVARVQMHSAVATERERERMAHLRGLQAAHLALSNVAEDAKFLEFCLLNDEESLPETKRILDAALIDLREIQAHQMPPVVASHFYNLRALIDRLRAWVGRQGAYTNSETAIARAEGMKIRKIADRGVEITWAMILLTITPDELSEERKLRAAISAVRERMSV